VFTLHLAIKSSSFARFSIDTWTDRLLILARLWRHRRRGMLSNKYSWVRRRWRGIRGFQQDASWSRVHWRSEIRRGPFERKQPGAAPAAKLRCVVAFNAPSG